MDKRIQIEVGLQSMKCSCYYEVNSDIIRRDTDPECEIHYKKKDKACSFGHEIVVTQCKYHHKWKGDYRMIGDLIG